MEENINPVFVVDASYVLSFLMPDEQSTKAVSIFNSFSKHEIHVLTTTLLPYEVINSLRTNTHRKRISTSMAHNLVDRFVQLNIPELSVDINRVIQLALNNNITCYDASYIALAKEKHAKLLTFDER